MVHRCCINPAHLLVDARVCSIYHAHIITAALTASRADSLAEIFEL